MEVAGEEEEQQEAEEEMKVRLEDAETRSSMCW